MDLISKEEVTKILNEQFDSYWDKTEIGRVTRSHIQQCINEIKMIHYSSSNLKGLSSVNLNDLRRDIASEIKNREKEPQVTAYRIRNDGLYTYTLCARRAKKIFQDKVTYELNYLSDGYTRINLQIDTIKIRQSDMADYCLEPPLKEHE